ncbi:RNA polymerase sigma factor SigJ [Diaminobutyricimonas sp. TR449]|uniref:RNA polymerase sigma factor SigJ n=1 Tax=Diaminobutyricimonas sp. TR449 TaxID=2708076 RepID=UPI001AB061DD|nr:RNA polymerase sigma factor SigJ [Diaminobutyricimonas sp. TR449]
MRAEASVTENATVFAEHRPAMVGAAYRVLGKITDAEDAVQETWLRFADVDLARVEHPRAYLLQAVTRQSLNAVRHQQRLRETYIGPWLPEPIADVTEAGADAAAELSDSVSFAMLVVLESLSPTERAAFILHDVFGLGFDEIADTLGKTPAAVRQVASRARGHVRERAPRHPVDKRTHREVTERFLAAAVGGSLEDLISMLAPDVVMYTDGGGFKKAALHPIRTPEKVLRFVLGVLNKPDAPIRLELTELNGEAAILGLDPTGVDSAISFVLDGDKVTEIYVVRNPQKLGRVSRRTR